jgi:tripartite-type tricarboxylate transporter receptor subunit TctC
MPKTGGNGQMQNRTDMGKAILVAALVMIICVTHAVAQAFPTRNVTLISPQSAGTTLDIVARLYADKLSQKLGQSFIVSNRPGAGGSIAAQAVVSADPDGHTLLIANSGHAILGALNKNLAFDTLKDFAAIAMIGDTPAIVFTIPQLGVKTLKDFVDLAKAKPGTINYGSAGVGTATHLAGAYFAYKAGIEIVHIPYKASSEGIADTLAGRVQAGFAPAAFTLSYIREGKFVPLAVSSTEAMKDPIAVPSARDANIDYIYSTWYGFLAPSKTPKPVLDILNRAIAEVSEDPEIKAKIVAQGITPRFKSLSDFDAHIKADMDRLRPVLDAINAPQKN